MISLPLQSKKSNCQSYFSVIPQDPHVLYQLDRHEYKEGFLIITGLRAYIKKVSGDAAEILL
jgi:hypothetical protein